MSFNPWTQLVELNSRYILLDWTQEEKGKTNLESLFEMQDNNNLENVVSLSIILNKSILMERELPPRIIAQQMHDNSKILHRDRQLNIQFTSDLESDVWLLKISISRKSKIWKVASKTSLDDNHLLLQSRLFHALKNEQTLICGIRGISNVKQMTKKFTQVNINNGKLEEIDRQIFVTEGSNLEQVCLLPEVDLKATTTNDIHQIFNVFGLGAARKAIEKNLYETMVNSKANVAKRHMSLVAHTMCYTGKLVAMTFAGMNSRPDASYLKLATFERCLDSFIGAAITGQKDNLRGVSEAIFTGTQMSLGTGGDFEAITREKNKEKMDLNQINQHNWNIICNNLKRQEIQAPNLNVIYDELKEQDLVPLILNAVKVEEKCKLDESTKFKKLKRKQMEEVAKWGNICKSNFIPSSPKRQELKMIKEEVIWSISSKKFIPSSP